MRTALLRWPVGLLAAVILGGGGLAPVLALDDAHHQKAEEAIARGIAFLRTTQGQGTDFQGHPADAGAWSPGPGPAITGLALTVMLDQPNAKLADPAIAKALSYIKANVHPDGSIHSGMLENYNTAICLSALARVNDQPEIKPIIKKAQDYLRGLQWAGQKDPNGRVIDEGHPWYGAAGYGEEGRPDMSNTATMLQALYDSGVDCNDPAFQRALVFLTRCQGTAANKEFGGRIAPDGGFIYATSKDAKHMDELETKVGTAENAKGEDLDDGSGVYKDEQGVSRLRTYGSMTAAGFQSYAYAKLDRHDPRVLDAFKWVRSHYTLDENPGVGPQGHYYFLMAFARALKAWQEPAIVTPDGSRHDWANDLVDKLVALQKPDGSWANSNKRWFENNANLATCYALIALQAAVR
jgi:squalene-hopene/tetraprenyl-beta-curcumene cyclase